MYKILFNKKSLSQTNNYVKNYRSYHENVYQDSWIWSEDIIIDSYRKESIFRYDEILDTILNKLSTSVISYPNNKVVIRWRSKILLVSFIEKWDMRTIIDIEIR